MTNLILTPWFSKHAPLRPPDWRWLRIRQLCATDPPCRSLPGEDESGRSKGAMRMGKNAPVID